MSEPFEFPNREELIGKLARDKARLAEFFKPRFDSLEEVVRNSVAGNTFRSFGGMPRKPSVIFREWAFGHLSSADFIPVLEQICLQEEYDTWLMGFAENLSFYWESKMGKEKAIQHGPKMKLCNLLLRWLTLWSRLKSGCRDNLINLIHVPLDRYVLVAIRNCIDFKDQPIVGRIPKTATMCFARSEDIYMRLQENIRTIAFAANVPPIYVDILAWNERHL